MSSSQQELHVDGAVPDEHVPVDASMDISIDDMNLDGDHGLVDQHDFNYLVTRTATLEHQMKNVNENLTRVTSLLEQYLRSQVPGTSSVPRATEGATMPSPTPRTALDPVVPPLTSPDVPNMLKNMKPPAFKGEERERSKDAVNTFLHKWSDLHALRRTPDNICALETSLSLEGKAYKWWMSLKMADRPTSWTRFQEVFRKEFLPENEPDRNWAAWDKCRMDKLTLTQYISKYREIILKLEGLDDFQKVRGFLRGLNDEYKTKVKTQYPKTLEDAIKSAQIFDDSLDKASSMSAWGKLLAQSLAEISLGGGDNLFKVGYSHKVWLKLT
ncbi:hypothetical protein L7F22_063792 [Adiantum nelumboides]|nr:hypothetical protein [Adiantum nelumboides]